MIIKLQSFNSYYEINYFKWHIILNEVISGGKQKLEEYILNLIGKMYQI